MSVAALIVAAGRGSRAGDGIPKQYRLLHGKPVLTRTLETFLAHGSIEAALVVIHPDDQEFYETSLKALPADLRPKLLACVHGGETRQDSVGHGLQALAASSPDIVLIHDAARPFATASLIERAVKAA